MTNKTIYQFAMETMAANSFKEAKDLVMSIILAAAHDSTLVDEAFKHVNDELMDAAMDSEASNQSEFN